MDAKRFIGRAPGRLDFMGGVADYSGSLVLEISIAAETVVEVTEMNGLKFQFENANDTEFPGFEMSDAGEFTRISSYGEFTEMLDRRKAPRWTRYIMGCLAVLLKESNLKPDRGLNFRVRSQVPHCMGVSSSAALEVATLRALAGLFNIEFSGTELARFGQIAENHVVGAPCGLMDQLTAAYGRKDAILPILCRPDLLREPVDLPDSATVVGWPSDASHDVGGSPYGTARTATFMGKRIFEAHTGSRRKYASEIRPDEIDAVANSVLPARMTGAEFLQRFSGVDDPLSDIAASTVYPVGSGLSFPIMENARCERALELVASATGADTENALREIGRLLVESHAGYSEIGLGHKQTDVIVDALLDAGPENGIYGGRVSGGGSGGTVVVLLRKDAIPLLEAIRLRVGLKDAAMSPLIGLER